MKKEITISTNHIMNFIVTVFIIIFVFHMGSVISTYFYGEILKFFDFNNERNLPTYVATINLLISAYLLRLISSYESKKSDPYRFHWIILSLIFLFLACDEFFRIHDRLDRSYMGGWLKFYIIPVIVIGIYYLYFLKSLPRKIRYKIILAGSLFIAGAIGMEIVGVLIKTNGYNIKSLIYRLSITIEESLEFIGIILFIHALLQYIKIKKFIFKRTVFGKKINLH